MHETGLFAYREQPLDEKELALHKLFGESCFRKWQNLNLQGEPLKTDPRGVIGCLSSRRKTLPFSRIRGHIRQCLTW